MSEPVNINSYRMEATKKTVNERLREEMDARDQALRTALRNAEIGIGNEALTRKRFDAFVNAGFWSRLKWLFGVKHGG